VHLSSGVVIYLEQMRPIIRQGTAPSNLNLNIYRAENIAVKDQENDKIQSPQIKSSIKGDTNAVKTTAIERYRRGLKPVVETKIVPHLPHDLKPIYYQFLEDSKISSPYRYIDMDSKGTVTNNIRRPRDREILSEYPKLKMLIKGVKTPQQPLNINNSLTEESSKNFRIVREMHSKKLSVQPSID
jgi:hypothetical protein